MYKQDTGMSELTKMLPATIRGMNTLRSSEIINKPMIQ